MMPNIPGGLSGVYHIKNTVNGHRYIGGSVDIRSRWRVHRSRLNRQVHVNPILQNAWNKYGENGLEFNILLLCAKEDVLKYEQAYLDRVNPNYNIAENAQAPSLGKSPSEETRRKMSRAHMGKNNPNYGRKFSAEIRKRMGDGRKGIEHSEETKRKMSEAHKGIVFTEEHRDNLSKAFRGRKLSEEARRNMSEAQKGKVFSEETRKKLSKAKMGNTNGKSSWFKEGHEYQSHSINGGK